MPRTPAEPARDEAQAIVQQLRDVLAIHGVVPPSQLGRVNHDTARALIALPTREGPRT